jgi:hypothetical protein
VSNPLVTLTSLRDSTSANLGVGLLEQKGVHKENASDKNVAARNSSSEETNLDKFTHVSSSPKEKRRLSARIKAKLHLR